MKKPYEQIAFARSKEWGTATLSTLVLVPCILTEQNSRLWHSNSEHAGAGSLNTNGTEMPGLMSMQNLW